MKRGTCVLAAILLVVCPLLGGLWSGLPEGFFRFPPLLHKAHPQPAFDPAVFAGFAIVGLVAVALFVRPRWFGFQDGPPPTPSSILHPPSSFPRWGWIGLGLNLLAWIAAWTQPAWLGVLREYTFAPLWLGYVLVVDALVYRRRGSSRFSTDVAGFGALFPVSAVLWWYFEYLNRFVKNWWYEGSEVFALPDYVLFATLCFSTVLPAILETTDLLLTFPRLRHGYERGPVRRPWGGGATMAAGALGAAGLILLPRFSDQLFWLTWLAPFAVVAASLALARVETPVHKPGTGDYTDLFVLALAALVCGLFWEMWNFLALPKWHYAVPYVSVLHVFEMPLVGFLGYLPFGPMCWCLWALFRVLAGQRPPALPSRAAGFSLAPP